MSARTRIARLDEPVGASRGGGLTRARDAVELARALLAARRQRGTIIDADLFAEPAWDLLLELYIATREQIALPLSSASTSAGVPVSVSLRWIAELETRGLAARRRSSDDQAAEHVELTAQGTRKMDLLLGQMLTA